MCENLPFDLDPTRRDIHASMHASRHPDASERLYLSTDIYLYIYRLISIGSSAHVSLKHVRHAVELACTSTC